MKSSRRNFLKTAGVAGGGFTLGFVLPATRAWDVAAAASTVKVSSAAINAFVRVSSDGLVTLTIAKSEMGQGVFTGYAQLIGEELEVDWRKVRVKTGFIGADQYTGNSDSILTGFTGMREAGAAARSMLIAAAAKALQVPAAELVAESGAVVHRASGRRLAFGVLAARASTLSPPKSVTLKTPSEWRLIGKPLPRVDSREKSTGVAVFGLDVRLPGLHYAVIARAPRFGATVITFDAAQAKTIPGVLEVVTVPAGIAVIATNTWAASRGRDAIKIQWDAGLTQGFSTTELAEAYAAMAASPGVPVLAIGEVATAKAGATKHLAADYATPYLAHAPMEPLSCTVALSAEACHVYAATQLQTSDRQAAAAAAGLPAEKVHMHTTYLGSGFGRRAHPTSDFVRDAVSVAKTFPKPVMTVWSREDDIRGGWYRPQAHNRLTTTLGADGRPTTWTHTQVVQPIYIGTALASSAVDPKAGIDSSTHDGASDMPYAIPNIRVDVHQRNEPVPVLWMRSVGHSVTAFAIESFIDECAHAAGSDPLEYRLGLLRDKPRHVATLKLAAEKAGWGTKLPVGRARGIAVHQMSGTTTVAQVAEVSLLEGRPHVHRVIVAIDCGIAINPRSIAQQLEGAVAFGLSGALFGEITLEDGEVVQSNYNNYEIARFQDSPRVEAYIVASTAPPSGIGQEGVPPIAPAVTNALFSLTGIRARRLPLKHTAFS